MRNLRKSTYPGGKVLDYTHDELERIATVSDANGEIASYQYVGAERVAKRTLRNGVESTYSYDGHGTNAADDFGVKKVVKTLHSLDDTAIDHREYKWDKTGNKTWKEDKLAAKSTSYEYDPIDRLRKSIQKQNEALIGETGYALDNAGNRTQVQGLENPGEYLMTSALPEPADFQVNQYTAVPGAYQEYDLNGNLVTVLRGPPLTAPGNRYEYDYRNQLVAVYNHESVLLAEYAYDAFGRRTRKTVNSATTSFYYTGLRVCEERDSQDQVTASYTFGNYIDEVLLMERGGEEFYYLQDDQFSVVKLTDAQGAVVESYEYGDYGAPHVFDETGEEVTRSRFGNVYGFTGQRWDEESGFYYYRTRYMDPEAGRFITRDTIGIWGDPSNLGNGYTYVGNNPASMVDPYGEEGWDDVSAFGQQAWEHRVDIAIGAGKAAALTAVGLIAVGAFVPAAVIASVAVPLGILGAAATSYESAQLYCNWNSSAEQWQQVGGLGVGALFSGYAAAAPKHFARMFSASSRAVRAFMGSVSGGAKAAVARGAQAIKKVNWQRLLSKIDDVVDRLPLIARTPGGERGSSGQIFQGWNRSKAISLPAWRSVEIDMAHILPRHSSGGKLSANRTVFPDWMNDKAIERTIRNAYRGGKRVDRQGDRVIVQGSSEGLLIEMYVNLRTGVIETAYPKLK